MGYPEPCGNLAKGVGGQKNKTAGGDKRNGSTAFSAKPSAEFIHKGRQRQNRARISDHFRKTAAVRLGKDSFSNTPPIA
jgi:hypothetical protein